MFNVSLNFAYFIVLSPLFGGISYYGIYFLKIKGLKNLCLADLKRAAFLFYKKLFWIKNIDIEKINTFAIFKNRKLGRVSEDNLYNYYGFLFYFFIFFVYQFCFCTLL